MSVFSDLVTEVISITGRPDLETSIKSAIRSATLSAHTSRVDPMTGARSPEYYPKDIFETGIRWQTPAYIQSLDYKNVVPKWRAFKYLRKYDNNALDVRDAPGSFFELIVPELVLDSYNIQRDDVCYLAGDRMEIRSSTQDTYMLLGCYVYPNVVEATYQSWIAEEYPYAIIYAAVAIIYGQTGYSEEAGNMQGLASQHLLSLQSQIVAKGE